LPSFIPPPSYMKANKPGPSAKEGFFIFTIS
jgi:hypothetical protein